MMEEIALASLGMLPGLIEFASLKSWPGIFNGVTGNFATVALTA